MTNLPIYFAAFGLGSSELLVILGIMLLMFGGSKLPSLARGLGQSVREFKKASQEDANEDKAPKTKTTAEATQASESK